ncbi:hypothetical protein [Sinorhizobium fredii]|nr:hypothetical protein [Sinorhizobium fredii]
MTEVEPSKLFAGTIERKGRPKAKVRAAEIFCLFRDWLAGQIRELGAVERAEMLALHLLAWSQGVGGDDDSLQGRGIHPQRGGQDRTLAGLPAGPRAT